MVLLFIPTSGHTVYDLLRYGNALAQNSSLMSTFFAFNFLSTSQRRRNVVFCASSSASALTSEQAECARRMISAIASDSGTNQRTLTVVEESLYN